MNARQRAAALHASAFGAPPTRMWRAPGRVNLIGEHVDYSGGFVCPIAIDRETVVAASPRLDATVHVVSDERPDERSFSLHDGGSRQNAWSDYVQGIAMALARRGARLAGANLSVASDVPIGAGLSSSAALEVACGAALVSIAGETLDARALANAARDAENTFIGLQSGIMDPLIVALATTDHALLIDCRTQAARPVALPRGAAIVVADSGIRHELATSSYNDRRNEGDEAASALGMPLRDATLAAVARAPMAEQLRRRARHVVTENARVLEFVDALEKDDITSAGDAMTRSHRSLRDDYEVSHRTVDSLVDAALGVSGVAGARMTGGGFGGCIVVLVHNATVASLIQVLSERATAVWTVRAAAGASMLEAGQSS